MWNPQKEKKEIYWKILKDNERKRTTMKDIERHQLTLVDMNTQVTCEKLNPQHHQSSVCLRWNAFIKWKHLGNWTTPMGFVKISGHWVPFYTLVASTCYSTCERYWQVISLPRARAIWCCLAAGTLWSISSAGKGSLTWYLNAIYIHLDLRWSMMI